jgi:hypothetical protein
MAASALLAAGLVAVAEDAATPAVARPARHALATVRVTMTIWSDGTVTVVSADTVGLDIGRPLQPADDPVAGRHDAGPEWPTGEADRCIGTTKRGLRCKLRTRPGEVACRYHEGQSVTIPGQ